MVRNEDYFGGSRGKAKIGTVKFRTIVDPETQLAEMMTGGIDWIWDVPKEKAEQLEMMPQVTVVNADTMRVSYIGMDARSEEHTSELQSLMRISYAVFCLKKKN